MRRNYVTVVKDACFQSRKPIIYNMARIQNGWRLTAHVPPGAPSKDRLAVVQWFGDYQEQVRRVQPNCLVRFKAPDLYNYELDVLQLHPAGISGNRQAQLENLDTLWHQLSFDYA